MYSHILLSPPPLMFISAHPPLFSFLLLFLIPPLLFLFSSSPFLLFSSSFPLSSSSPFLLFSSSFPLSSSYHFLLFSSSSFPLFFLSSSFPLSSSHVPQPVCRGRSWCGTWGVLRRTAPSSPRTPPPWAWGRGVGVMCCDVI